MVRWAVLLLAMSAGHLSAQEARVRGTVTGEDGRPIAQAFVRYAEGGASTYTDAAGNWTLPRTGARVVVSSIGYREVTAATPADERHLRIVLPALPFSLEQVVVTAGRRTQRLADVAVSTEVLSRAEIEATGASDLAGVLSGHTGITVEGGHPVGAGVMLQGLGAERVLVLLDGQPVIGRISGKLDLGRIPAASIARIEIVKGPQSTLYGSEAMGGVVNVITRTPIAQQLDGGVTTTYGARGRLDLAGHVVGKLDRVGYAVDAGRRSIELVQGVASTAGTFATQYNGAAKLQWQVGAHTTGAASGTFLQEEQRWQTGQLYSFADNRQWSAQLGGTHMRGAHRFAPNLYVTEFRHDARRSTRPQAPNGNADTELQRLLEAELLYGFSGPAIAIDAGIEVRRESITSDRILAKQRSLDGAEPFAQVTLQRGAVSIVPGVRMSWSDQWGSHWTPRVAALIRPTEQLAVRASLGSGYRAPSFKELYMAFLNTAPGAGYRVEGNADLRPESSWNAGGGVEWAGERVYARLNGFYNSFDDFIETRELAPSGGLTVFTYGNVESGWTSGTEVELGAAFGGTRAELAYNHTRTRNTTDDRELLNTPQHTARLALLQELPLELRGGITARLTGATAVAFEENGAVRRRSAFQRIDAFAARSLPGGMEVRVGIDNLLDAQPADFPGFMGRQFHITFEWAAGPE